MKLISIETIAFTSGIVNIYLLTRCSLWNWFFGILTVSLYAIIFFNIKLYADMSLQGVFLFSVGEWGGLSCGKLPYAART